MWRIRRPLQCKLRMCRICWKSHRRQRCGSGSHHGDEEMHSAPKMLTPRQASWVSCQTMWTPVRDLANVQSLPKKTDDLLSLIHSQGEAEECSVFCLVETWLESNFERLATITVFHSDHLRESTGKTKKTNKPKKQMKMILGLATDTFVFYVFFFHISHFKFHSA